MSVIWGSVGPLIVKGVPTTILMTLALLGVGLLLGFPLAFAQVYGYRPFRWFCRAYEQIFRGAIQAISQGQMMAARSIGMSKLQAIRYIILPQAFRLSIPPWTNEFSSVLKDTSLASAIGVVELAKEGTLIMTRIQYALGAEWILIIWMVVALIYLVLTYAGNRSLAFLEDRVRIPGFEMRGRIER